MSGSLVPSAESSAIPQLAYPPSFSADPFGQQPQDPAVQIRRLVSALFRYKWLVAAIVLVGAAAGYAFTKMLRKEYTVHATIWIATDNASNRASGPIRSGGLFPTNSWPDLLASFKILDDVTQQLRLYVTPSSDQDAALFYSFAIAPGYRTGQFHLRVDPATKRYALVRDGLAVDSGAITDSIGRRLGFRWALSPSQIGNRREIGFSVSTPRDASLRIRSQLGIVLPEDGNLMGVSLSGDNGWRAAATLNAIVHGFIDAAADLKRRNLVEFSRTLEQQLAYAEAELRDADNALETFRARTITLPSEGTPVVAGLEQTRDPVFRSFFEQRIALDSLSHERQSMERTLAEFRRGTIGVDAFWAIAGVGGGGSTLRAALQEYSNKETQLRNAQAIYTDEHPTVRDLKASMRQLREQIIPQLASNLIAQFRDREAVLSDRIQAASKDLQSIPTRTIEEMRLRRNVDSRAALYSSLKTRYEEAKLAEASALPDVAVLDTAVTPLVPTSNKKPRVFAFAVLGSVALGLFLVLVLDRFDTRFRYPEQLKSEYGLQLLGSVPNARSKRKTPDPLRGAQLHESFRSLRLNVLYAAPSRGSTLLTVTSPGMGDGKSLIAANLALSFAEAGYRTLLIDGDVRRGALDATFGVSRRPGFTELIKGTATLNEVLRETTQPNLTLLPSGSRSNRAPELLASAEMARIINDLRQQFDVVLIDSSPLAAGIDPFVLSSMTGQVLVVMRVGKTNRKLARVKFELLSRFPTRVIGAVMNDVTLDSVYKEYSYLPGYSAVEEDDPELTSVSTG
jgi:capsular exopolysaccharide synthesis family protein